MGPMLLHELLAAAYRGGARSVDEIGSAAGYGPEAARAAVDNLARLGYIRRVGGRASPGGCSACAGRAACSGQANRPGGAARPETAVLWELTEQGKRYAEGHGRKG